MPLINSNLKKQRHCVLTAVLSKTGLERAEIKAAFMHDYQLTRLNIACTILKLWLNSLYRKLIFIHAHTSKGAKRKGAKLHAQLFVKNVGVLEAGDPNNSSGDHLL